MPPTRPADILPLRPRDHDDAARIAIQWLEQRHRKGWGNGIQSLLDHWRPQPGDDFSSLDRDGVEMVVINAGEWLLARGEIQARGGRRNINDYLLGADGPYLTPGQRQWIAQLRERPLRLYRVTGVRPGEGLTLLDELDADAEPLVVREISGSRSATPGMLLAARVMHAGQAPHRHLELSGAIYPFAKLREADVLEQVGLTRAGSQASDRPADEVRDLIELDIARRWLAQWFEPATLPQLIDAATGEPLLLITDHFRVADAAALAAALAQQPDVAGSAAAGWHREAELGAGGKRTLVAINPGKAADRVEVFCKSQRAADEGRAWFERVAGTAVAFLAREIVDPAGAVGRRDGSQVRTPAGPDLPPEVLAQAVEQVMRRHYANWCDEPIPALNHQTPRQAIGSGAAGLERVKGLLREYEDGERRMSAEQGRPAFSFQFLWDALDIRRDA